MLFCAMAHQRLNTPVAAQTWLRRARDWIAEADRVEAIPTETSMSRWYHWQERVLVQSLLTEAASLIGP
jgi:hypothetical protein